MGWVRGEKGIRVLVGGRGRKGREGKGAIREREGRKERRGGTSVCV